MGLVLKDSNDFQLAPEGQHQAVCVDVVDLGMVAVEWQGQKKTQHKCRLVWEVDEKMPNGKRFTVRRQFTASLGMKANLRGFLEAWRGRPFTDAELAGFDTEQLIGVNALIQVVHTKKGDKTYDNINAIMRLAKGMTPIEPTADYVRVQDRTNGQQEADEIPPFDESDSSVPF